MATGSNIIELIKNMQDVQGFRERHWEGTFEEYLDLVKRSPNVVRTAYQRMYDMIISFGTSEYQEYKKTITRYRFFDDPFEDGKDAVFGIDVHLMKLVDVFKAAAEGYGADRRVLLLHGPVGSAKSTIVRLLKKGLEHYSRTPEGALYTFAWDETQLGGSGWLVSPMNEEPLLLVPMEMREQVEGELNQLSGSRYPIRIRGELCPVSRYMYRELMKKFNGDWSEMIKHVKVRRLTLSEKDRVGIGTFQPKDEKNQDSTELTGDINYRKIAEYGSDSDPRAFNFDGEFCIANRGIIEFIEILKLDVAFLYDLLGASQEHKIKPKKFAQTDIDEVIIGHTNEPEYKRLQNNEFMEALRDRTIKIDIPYISRASMEVKIYQKDFNPKAVRKHIAPHTLEMAAMWAVLTRLEEPKKANLTLLQKLKLYDGKTLPGFTEDNIKELRKEAVREGMEGISPRYVQDKISNAMVKENFTSLNPFMVMNELESGLKHHSLLSSEDMKKQYKEMLAVVKKEYEDIVKNEVQKAIVADEDAISRLFGNYIENIKAYTQKEKVRNRFTGQYEEPNERLMRSIEEKIDIPVSRKDDFRREIMNYVGALSLEGKTFDYRTNERLHKALELKLFEDQKDSIKLTSLVSQVVDKETQAKIDIVKDRLIKQYGYNDESATDVLNFVASIFARGDVKH
jgi:serine protein kinase